MQRLGGSSERCRTQRLRRVQPVLRVDPEAFTARHHDLFLDEAEQHLHGADLRPELSPDGEEGAMSMPTPEPDS